MTLSVFVTVPEGAGWTAEVATLELRDGRPVVVRARSVPSGGKELFHPRDGAAILVAEGRERGPVLDLGGLVIFPFALGQPVKLVGSEEIGNVIGRAEYAESSRSYLVRYRAADGRLTEQWWGEAALSADLAPTPAPALAAQQA